METTTIVISGLGGVIASVITAYFTARLSVRQEREEWQRELAQKIAELRITDASQAQSLIKQFAVGYLLTHNNDNPDSSRYFVPPTGRLSVGKASYNDVVVDHPSIEHHHALFEAIGSDVFLVNLQDSHTVAVNGEAVFDRRKLGWYESIYIGEIQFMFTRL